MLFDLLFCFFALFRQRHYWTSLLIAIVTMYRYTAAQWIDIKTSEFALEINVGVYESTMSVYVDA